VDCPQILSQLRGERNLRDSRVVHSLALIASKGTAEYGRRMADRNIALLEWDVL
jgi:hypothetical protein